jgi:hypothetical protein
MGAAVARRVLTFAAAAIREEVAHWAGDAGGQHVFGGMRLQQRRLGNIPRALEGGDRRDCDVSLP